MYDSIKLADIRVAAALGATLDERRRCQEICIDLEFTLDMSAARRYDRLEGTVDYAVILERVRKVVVSKPFALLEHLAEEIVATICVDPLVRGVQVEIAKPGFLAGVTPKVCVRGRRPTNIAVGLGANLGDPPRTMARALTLLKRLGKIIAHSSLYLTKPWGVADQPDFYNAAVLLETTLMPHAVLAALQAIERESGRTAGARFGPRLLDCDFLDDDGMRIDDADLTVPHPRLEERAFVLAPLCEISERYRPAFERLSLSERAGVVRLAEWPGLGSNVGIL
jgi:2-amino-4-hydroxy-6-hydroxymethyldihydropteridine diphosphokinase/dihydroneopterin aldolase